MNWDEIAGTWKQFRGKIKEKVGTLTNDDLMAVCRETRTVCREDSTGLRLSQSTIEEAVRSERAGAHPCQEFTSYSERSRGSTLTSLGASANGFALLKRIDR